ncbi:MAG: PfkB family carbohydrate kinase [bacterium]
MKKEEIIKKFQGKKILVIGDIMLDKYVWGSVERISPEAPVPVLTVSREVYVPGGAANVACNIKSLRGNSFMVGIIGNDEAGQKLKSSLKEKGVDTSGVFVDDTRPTITKIRFVAEKRTQQLIRIDYESKRLINEKLQKKIIEFVSSCATKFDAILFEDYDKGMLQKNLIKKLISIFKNKIITVDPKFDNFFAYEGVTLFKPNKYELERAVGEKLTHNNIEPICKKVRKQLNCKAVLLTLGKEGMLLVDSVGAHKIPAKVREVYDETAAGDAAIAGTTIALATNASLIESAGIGNIVAGIEVSKFGTVPVTYEELLKDIRE